MLFYTDYFVLYCTYFKALYVLSSFFVYAYKGHNREMSFIIKFVL